MVTFRTVWYSAFLSPSIISLYKHVSPVEFYGMVLHIRVRRLPWPGILAGLY